MTGRQLARLRRRAGMAQRELARRAGVSPGHLSRVESGERPATVTLLAAIGRALKGKP